MKIRDIINTIINGTHNHFACFLPGKAGFISSFVLNCFFAGIRFDDDQKSIIQNVPDDAIIVYTAKYKSLFDFLFSYTRYHKIGLPFPELGLGYNVFTWQPVSRLLKIVVAFLDYFFCNLAKNDPFKSGYIKQEISGGRSAFMFLVEKKAFYDRFVKAKTDTIHHLIEIQKSIDRPIYIVPQLIFFSKKPSRFNPNIVDILFGSEEKPGKIRRLITLFKNPGKVFVEISEPVNLKGFISADKNREFTNDQLSRVLRRDLILKINRHRQSVTGPLLKTTHELKEDILTNDHMLEFMKYYAKKHNLKVWEVHKKAGLHLDEIAAKYNIASIKLFSVLVRWVLRGMFDSLVVNYDMLKKIKEKAKDGPLIFAPCHKSHIDYLILSYFLFKNDMPCPLIAAGKNLSFWPLGPIFRSTGAFFIRRSFKGAVLYSKVFTEYIYKLLEEGFNIEFFIEGGRSRTGKLLRPQLGLFSIIINAYKNGACDEMNIVPIYVGYDRVIEESAYIHEIEGGQKEPESLTQVIKARKFLKKVYGKIYIQFNEPISLKEITEQNSIPLGKMTSKEVNALCRNIGNRILNSIDNVTVVTPHALVAGAILNCSRRIFSYDHLMSHIDTYLNYLYSQRAKLSDTLVADHTHAVLHVIDVYVNRKFLNCISNGKKGRLTKAKYKININKRPALDYYKNNCIALFIPAAFTALSILEKDSFRFSASELHSNYTLYQDLFQNEFYCNKDRPAEYMVRKTVKAFIDDAILTPHPTLADTYSLTSEGFRKLKLFSRFLKTFFESHWIVLNFFKNNPRNSIKAKDRLKKIQSFGNSMYKRGEIELKESLSKVNYRNAVDFFIAHGIRGSESQERIEFYSNAIQKSLNNISS